jgi:uncharacterized protein (TIGR03086 family)
MTTADPPVSVAVLEQACTLTGGTLARVTRDQLGDPTPCGDWPVRGLIDHIVGATDFFADLAEFGASPEDRDWPGYGDGDFAAAFERQRRRLVAGFAVPGALGRIMALPTGPTPGAATIEVATGEIFVHGWDLARATGHALPPAAEQVAAALLASGWVALSEQVRRSDQPPFAPERPAGPHAPAADRLVAFLGRDPAWPGPP